MVGLFSHIRQLETWLTDTQKKEKAIENKQEVDKQIFLSDWKLMSFLCVFSPYFSVLSLFFDRLSFGISIVIIIGGQRQKQRNVGKNLCCRWRYDCVHLIKLASWAWNLRQSVRASPLSNRCNSQSINCFFVLRSYVISTSALHYFLLCFFHAIVSELVRYK